MKQSKTAISASGQEGIRSRNVPIDLPRGSGEKEISSTSMESAQEIGSIVGEAPRSRASKKLKTQKRRFSGAAAGTEKKKPKKVGPACPSGRARRVGHRVLASRRQLVSRRRILYLLRCSCSVLAAASLWSSRRRRIRRESSEGTTQSAGQCLWRWLGARNWSTSGSK